MGWQSSTVANLSKLNFIMKFKFFLLTFCFCLMSFLVKAQVVDSVEIIDPEFFDTLTVLEHDNALMLSRKNGTYNNVTPTIIRDYTDQQLSKSNDTIYLERGGFVVVDGGGSFDFLGFDSLSASPLNPNYQIIVDNGSDTTKRVELSQVLNGRKSVRVFNGTGSSTVQYFADNNVGLINCEGSAVNGTIEIHLDTLVTAVDQFQATVYVVNSTFTQSGATIEIYYKAVLLGTMTNTDKYAFCSTESAADNWNVGIVGGGGSDGNGIYDGSGNIPTATNATVDGTFAFQDSGADMMTFDAGTNVVASEQQFNVNGGLSISLSGSEASNIIDTRGTPTGLVYTADLSATYTNRSLVDKEYVDNQFSGLNTLYNADDTIAVARTAHVTDDFLFRRTSDNLIYFWLDFSTGRTKITADSEFNGTMFVNDGATISLAGSDAYTINDTRAGTVGLVYGADYSGGFTDRSLVDKGYVDGEIATIPDTFYVSIAHTAVGTTISSGTSEFFEGVPSEWNGATIVKAHYQQFVTGTVATNVGLEITADGGGVTNPLTGSIGIGNKNTTVTGSVTLNTGDAIQCDVPSGTPDGQGLVVNLVIVK